MGGSHAPPQPIAPADIAIVVPVGGAAEAWPRSARSLARLDPPPGEIVVVIDGPDDHLATTAAGLAATTVVLAERSGPAKARNRGAGLARCDILLFVDADIEVPADLVATVARIFTDHPGLTAVIGSYDDAPGEAGFVSQYRNLLHHFVHQTARDEASTFWAGCGAVRRLAFHDLGGFDGRWANPSIEDIELGSRLVRAGHTIRLAKDLQVKHLKRWQVADMLATDLWRRAVPWTELMLGEGQLVNDLNVKTRDRVSVVVACVALLALLGAWRWPMLLGAAAGAMVLIVALNALLFRFFLSRRGALFAAGAVPLYWIYLLICGLGFALGLGRHLARERR
jgi:cellulose synthase/poly-beta-1,6-N-acetylglucosamine synthase-like glycosyltransferase